MKNSRFPGLSSAQIIRLLEKRLAAAHQTVNKLKKEKKDLCEDFEILLRIYGR